MRKFLLLLIRAYQYLISPMLGPHCRFHPTCSCYAHTAVERHGVLRGGWLALRRLSKCHPWHPGGEDPVPEPSPELLPEKDAQQKALRDLHSAKSGAMHSHTTVN